MVGVVIAIGLSGRATDAAQMTPASGLAELDPHDDRVAVRYDGKIRTPSETSRIPTPATIPALAAVLGDEQ